MPSGSYIMRPREGVNIKFGADESGSFLLVALRGGLTKVNL